MDALKIRPTVKSLEVSLDPGTGKLVFSGRSYPENSVGFFKPVIEWLEKYALQPAPSTECTFRIEYFNSASRKNVVDILKVLESIQRGSHAVKVIWCYEAGDDGMKESGEEYQNLFKLNFIFSPF